MSARSFSPGNSMDKVGVTHRCDALTTTSGTLSTASLAVTPAATCGFTLAKTAGEVGRYTLTFDDKRLKFGSLAAVVQGADDTAFTAAKGLVAAVRDNDMAAGADDGTIELQMLDPATSADAEVQDGATICIVVETYK